MIKIEFALITQPVEIASIYEFSRILTLADKTNFLSFYRSFRNSLLFTLRITIEFHNIIFLEAIILFREVNIKYYRGERKRSSLLEVRIVRAQRVECDINSLHLNYVLFQQHVILKFVAPHSTRITMLYYILQCS